MFEMQQLYVSYGRRQVLENFNLCINKGEIVALVGESGSGKSTAIRAAFSLLPYEGSITQGDILLHGESLLEKSTTQWAAIRGKQIAMIFQDSGAMLNPIGKIKWQFIEYLRLHKHMSKKEAHQKAIDMLAATHLSNPERVMNAYPFQLSGGMRQRVGIAMAMVFNPGVLLADEPTSALDATTQKQIILEMMQLRDKYNTTIIIVTHNLGVAAYMADRILVMQDGRIVEQGSSSDIINQPQHSYTKKLLKAVPKAKAGNL